MHCIYLHGFASGPASSKARFFASKLKEHYGVEELDLAPVQAAHSPVAQRNSVAGITLEIPDLNVPDFENLTLTSQLNKVEQLIGGRKNVLLIGSSMGGLIATLASCRNPGVRGLILLAPGFGLSRRWQTLWGDDAMSRWQRDGFLEVFHHARQATAKLGFQFVADAARYDSENLEVACPTLILHGRRDDIVPVEESIKFQCLNSSVSVLKILEDDHQLLSTLDSLWQHSSSFIDSFCLSSSD